MEKVYQYTITDQEIFENIFKDEKLLMNHVIVPPGKVFPKHPTDAIVYALITRGELSVTIENNAFKTFKAGQLVNIPKGVSTELGNRGDEYLELFVMKHDYDVKMIKIRNEEETDYERVEEITRKAFWNLYIPGCVEHYLAHVMRSHKDFLPELDLVIEVDNQIIGNIMYTKTKLVDESGEEKDILTFGPVCILPEYQRKGYGKKLMEYSFEQAASLDYDVIVIFGNPNNYVSSGFKSCKKYNVCLENGTYPSAMMVKELKPDVLDGRKWVYYQSPVFEIDEQEARRFDEGLESLKKKYQPSQEEFFIHSHSIIQ